MIRRPFHAAAWTALGLVLAGAGYLLISTTFMIYDDEGFVLLSLRNYLAGLRLYDDVFSQYGPWPYVYHQIVTLGGVLPLTHDFGRLLTLAHWLMVALLSGTIAWQLTRSLTSSLAAGALVFGLTWQMISEPSHPGSLASAMVALAGLGVARLPTSSSLVRTPVGLGILAGLALLTKINVGLLLAAGVGGWLLRQCVWHGRASHLLPWCGTVGLLVTPWVLLGGSVTQGWALKFALFETVAIAGILWVHSPQPGSARPTVRVASMLIAAMLAAGVVVGVVMARGTSLGALVDTILLQPLRMPAWFTVPVAWYAPTVPLAIASGLAVFFAGRESRRGRPLGTAGFWLIAALRLLTLVSLACFTPRWPSLYGVFHFVSFCLPLLPLFAVPLRRESSSAQRLAVSGVALVAALQVLHAFPVAGSQLAWGSFLCVPVLFTGWWDLAQALTERYAARGLQAGRTLLLTLGASATVVILLLLNTGWKRYSTSQALGLPGAHSIRLDGDSRAGLRLMQLNAQIHADLLFSRPGMYSHNLWSELPTPTAKNATHWVWLLNAKEQQAIVDRLAATPRTAVITSTDLEAFMTQRGIPLQGALHDFLTTRYRTLLRYGTLEFQVPRDSNAAPFGRYEIFRTETAAGSSASLLLRTNIAFTGAPARVELGSIDPLRPSGPELLGPGSQVFLERIDRAGQPRGGPISLPVSAPVQGLFRLSILTPAPLAGVPWQRFALIMRDDRGAVLSESFY